MTTQAPQWVKSKQYTKVNGHSMTWVELGQGDPIVLWHGNPTSSYLWRKIAPRLADLGRVVLPDLIGMGDSDKLENSGASSYRFVDHRAYLDGFLDAVGVERRVVFVVHDWGSDWARRNPAAVKGIAYMEAAVCSITLDERPPEKTFAAVRSADGEQMVLDKNVFVEKILPRGILRELTDEEMDEDRRPFAVAGEDQRPTLTWPREMPRSGEPADIVEIVDKYSQWLATSDVPKRFINAEPGAILTGRTCELCRTFPVRGGHRQRDTFHPGRPT